MVVNFKTKIEETNLNVRHRVSDLYKGVVLKYI